MKLAISNIAWEKSQDESSYALLRELGFCGLEIAPTRVLAENPYNHLPDAEKWSLELKRKYGLEVASVQSVWFGRDERLFGKSEERESLMRYTEAAIDFAAVVGSRNLVFGCPRNRTIPDEMPSDEAEKIAVDFFERLGEYAWKRNTVLAIEANPPIYHTNYLNTTAEAFELVKKIDSGGIRLNVDMGTILQNGENIEFLGDKADGFY